MLENLISKMTPLFQSLLVDVLTILYVLSPIYIPFFLGYICWNLWVGYKKFDFITKQERILLEIKMPQEIKKTPLAMELVLNSLHQTSGESTWFDRNFKGKSRAWFSLEMVSIDGDVKFFVWTQKFYKNLVESYFYAQYPNVEIYEVPEYTQFVKLDFNEKSIWGTEFKLEKDDPYPIKTYVDYGLDKPGLKDDEKTDPITPVIELLGSMEKGEQMWIQILVRAHKKNFKEKLSWEDRFKEKSWSKDVDWTSKGKKEIKSLLEKLQPEEGKFMRTTTKGEQNIITAIERNIDKVAFDCGIRCIYLAEKDKFNPVNAPGLVGSFKQYNSEWLNKFKTSNPTSFDYPWQDYKNIRLNKKKKEMFDLYKRRAYFYWPYRASKQFVLSSEELATIFHLPGGVAQTPTFSRITSKKSEPPTNLPF